MCGIAGFVGSRLPVDEADAALGAMCGAISHRGPDDEGRHVGPGVAIGMRRLAIIDVAHGQQPIYNEDGSIAIVFNGEIYNHHELRSRLRSRGHQLKTQSDTECLVHLYEDHGTAMLPLLRGMFAFAIWDQRTHQLFIARDRLGIKPLYYSTVDEGLAFASELRALLTLPGFRREIDDVAVARYLSFGYVPDPDCIYAGTRKLPPGHALTWSADAGVEVHRWWVPPRNERGATDPRELIEEARRQLSEAVSCHLESEVPLGAFLSGGVDSSTVVSLMARALDRQVSTFSIGFDEPRYNEAPHAAAVARAIGTRHTELIVRPDADAITEDLVRLFDEPFADSSALPTLLVCQMARSHVTVALSGDGGDELFGGYTRYQTTLGRRSVQSSFARDAIRSLARSLPHATPFRNRLLDLARSPAGRYASQIALPLLEADGGIVRDDLARRTGPPEALMSAWFEAAQDRDFATQLMLVDLESYLPGDILTKVDRTSMAVSLEARVPLLDHHVVEFAMQVPSSLKIRDGQGKWLLREAIRGLVPDIVLSHPKKGFAVPIDQWLRRELRRHLDRIGRPGSRLERWIRPEAVARVTREHLTARRDHQLILWRLIVLDLWLEALGDGHLERPTAPNAHASALVREVTAR